MSEYEPITTELRAALDVDREFMRADGTVVAQTFCVDRNDFERLCDAIDAVHAGLERENAELRAKLDNMGESMHDGWVLISRDGNGYADCAAFTHHHAPTVEDVLTEFGIDWEYESNCEDRAALLKEYAKRLRLSGDAE